MSNRFSIDDLHHLAGIVHAGGSAAMEFYGDDLRVELKADQSPLTQADMASHRWLIEGLTEWQPEIPIVSEESEGVADLERLPDLCWLIDPLDGTKEFISLNGEFTVNVALIENGRPIMGCFCAPAIDTTYAAAVGVGTFRLGPVRSSSRSPHPPTPSPRHDVIRGEGEPGPSPPNPHSTRHDVIRGEGEPDPSPPSPLSPPFIGERGSAVRIAVSRSHLDAKSLAVIEAIRGWLGEVELIPMGSSLKMGLVADGQADLYLRPAPTSKWDTGAGDAVATFAGGMVIDLTTGEELRYDGPGILNPPFAVLSQGFAALRGDLMKVLAGVE